MVLLARLLFSLAKCTSFAWSLRHQIFLFRIHHKQQVVEASISSFVHKVAKSAFLKRYSAVFFHLSFRKVCLDCDYYSCTQAGLIYQCLTFRSAIYVGEPPPGTSASCRRTPSPLIWTLRAPGGPINWVHTFSHYFSRSTLAFLIRKRGELDISTCRLFFWF